MIFKLQRRLAQDDPDTPVLAYTQGRRNMIFLRPTADLLAFFDGGPRLYVNADIGDEGGLSVRGIVPNQDW
jgi:hypothetical protein